MPGDSVDYSGMTLQTLAMMFTLEAMTVEVALDFLFFAESGFTSAARSNDFGFRSAIQFVADGDVGHSLSSHSDVLCGQLAFHELPIQLLRDGQSCRTAGAMGPGPLHHHSNRLG